jgi:NADPH-ferrihemoprotein reductase
LFAQPVALFVINLYPSAVMDSFTLPVDMSDLKSQLNPLLQALSATPVLSSLKPSTTADGLAAFLFLLTSLGYLTRGRIWDKPDPNYHVRKLLLHELESSMKQHY